MIKVTAASADPIQEKLRQTKKLWNKQVSEFADDMFRLKDMMNGKPSKFFSEKSSIKEPIPGDPVTIIGSLSGDFQEIVQKGNDIIRQQIEYSKTRKRKQPKQLPVTSPFPANPSTTTDLSKQLSASVDAYELAALGSNPLSRFFTHLLNPGIGNSSSARMRKYRTSLLKSASEIYKDLRLLQVSIVESSPESIFVSSKLLSKIQGNWNFFKTGLDAYKELRPNAEPSSEGGVIVNKDKENISIPSDYVEIDKDNKNISINPKVKPTTPSYVTKSIIPVAYTSTADKILSDYKNLINFTDIDSKKLTLLLGKWRMTQGPEKEIAAKNLENEYESILNILNSKYGTTGSSFREILEAKKSKANDISDQLEAIGEKAIQRWLGKLKHKISPFDKTSAHRLDIYKMADETRLFINEIMDSLEKEMNVEFLEMKFQEVSDNFNQMSLLIDGLSSLLHSKDFDKSFINLLEGDKITNFSPNLNTEQQKHLQRMLERRRLKQLTDFYQGRK